MKVDPAYLNTIIDELNMMVVIISKDNTLISANKRMLEFANVKLDDIRGETLWELPWLKHDPELQNKLLFALSDSYLGGATRFNVSSKDGYGNEAEIDFIIKPVMEDGEPDYFIAMGYNITELVNARKALTERERRIKAFFDYSIEGYFFLSLPDKIHRSHVSSDNISEIIDHYHLDDVSKRFCEIVDEEILSAKDIFRVLDMKEHLFRSVEIILEKGSVTYDKCLIVDGKKKHIQLIFVAIFDEEMFEGSFGIVRDVTEQVKQLERITFYANKDFLTGINNRRNFFYEGQLLYDKCKKDNQPLALVMFDIDHFKKVNDTYGHDSGDVVIRDLAKLVSDKLASSSVFGRYGGEEYIVLVEGTMDKVYRQFDDIRELVDQTVFDKKHKPIHITISLGLYLINFEEDTIESGITNADKALYESKENGRNQSTIFIEYIHGQKAWDPLTDLYTEMSLKYKLNKALYDIKTTGDSLWLIYIKMNVMKEDRLLTEPRHYKTMALCLKKSIRSSDYVGLIGKRGFLVVLRNVTVKQVEDKHQRITENIEIGFSGMINNVVRLKSCIFNASKSRNLDEVLEDIEKELNNLY